MLQMSDNVKYYIFLKKNIQFKMKGNYPDCQINIMKKGSLHVVSSNSMIMSLFYMKDII